VFTLSSERIRAAVVEKTITAGERRTEDLDTAIGVNTIVSNLSDFREKPTGELRLQNPPGLTCRGESIRPVDQFPILCHVWREEEVGTTIGNDHRSEASVSASVYQFPIRSRCTSLQCNSVSSHNINDRGSWWDQDIPNSINIVPVPKDTISHNINDRGSWRDQDIPNSVNIVPVPKDTISHNINDRGSWWDQDIPNSINIVPVPNKAIRRNNGSICRTNLGMGSRSGGLRGGKEPGPPSRSLVGGRVRSSHAYFTAEDRLLSRSLQS
jgi:hypothetical protein